MARILVVDDSQFLRNRVGDWLRQGGHEVVCACDGCRGLEAIRTEAPDCVLLDLAMPAMSGVQMLTALAEAGSRVPVVVMTADVQHSTSETCMRLGAFEVLHKPPSQQQVLDGIDRALAARKEA